MENISEQNTYKTKNLNIASYLLVTQKVQFIKVNKENPKEMWFLFSDPQTCTKLEKQFWMDEALVSPKQLLYALNELKDRMFN